MQYPTEYIKTRRQLLSPVAAKSNVRILTTAVRTSGPGVLYTGASAFCVSNTLKSGVRFLTFDTVRDQLPRNERTGKPAASSTMLAGVAAGVAESVTVVTPGESIKTRMVQNRSVGEAATSTSHVVRGIVSTNGIAGLWRGVAPVSMKQGSNALIRFTSYATILDLIRPPLEKMGAPGASPAIAGAAAGIVTVFGTMPFDVLKTRMQSQKRVGVNRGLRQCLADILTESGVKGLWKGTTPRLVRLSVSVSPLTKRRLMLVVTLSDYAYTTDIRRCELQYLHQGHGIDEPNQTLNRS